MMQMSNVSLSSDNISPTDFISSNSTTHLFTSSPSIPSSDLEWMVGEFTKTQSRVNKWENALVLSAYVPLFLLAASANALVIFVVCKYQYMHSVTNYFLVNLSVADLLVTLICMPAAMGQTITAFWLFGETMCKLTAYLQGVSVGASVFTLTAMSIDRYMAVRHSMAFRKVFNNHATVFVIFILWLVPLLISGPLLWVRKTVVDLDSDPLAEAVRAHGLVWCIEDWGQRPKSKYIYGIACFVLVYASPVCVVIIAYAAMGRNLWSVRPPFDREEGSITMQQIRLVRERRRVARLLLVLASLFAICWLPYNIIALVLDLDIGNQNVFMKMYPFALLLGHANSAINPLLYCFMTRNFRRTVKTLLFRRGRNTRPGRKHSCKVCCRFQPRSLTSSSGYESCGGGGNQMSGRDKNAVAGREHCMVLTTLRGQRTIPSRQLV